jgi:hypothetical protein
MNDLIDSYVPGIKDWYVSQSFLSIIHKLFEASPDCFVQTFDRLTAVCNFTYFDDIGCVHYLHRWSDRGKLISLYVYVQRRKIESLQ